MAESNKEVMYYESNGGRNPPRGKNHFVFPTDADPAESSSRISERSESENSGSAVRVFDSDKSSEHEEEEEEEEEGNGTVIEAN